MTHGALYRLLGQTVAGLCLLAAPLAPAEERLNGPAADYVRAHYTKYEYRIPMRDGVRLFTSVYVPKDHADSWPILMNRTPYSVEPYGEDQYRQHLGPSEEFERAGYIFVYQDVRGRYMSEGQFVEMTPHVDPKDSPGQTDDSSDTSDTVDWLLKHVPGNNGKVGIYGISYPGFYTAASIIDSHPAIRAASPQAPMSNLYMGDDAYHNGAFMLAANFGFYTYFNKFPHPMTPAEMPADSFRFGTSDGYDFYLHALPTSVLATRYLKEPNPFFSDQLNHTTWDSYWKSHELTPRMHNVRCAVLVVGGWFDAEDLQGPWNIWRSVAEHNPGTPDLLVEGPWVHGGWAFSSGAGLGDVRFDSDTAEYFRREIQFPFFEYYLKGKGEAPKGNAMFETGTNLWHRYATWPPPGAAARTLYLHSGGGLSFDPPGAGEGTASDEYLSDPRHPVPFVGYTTDDVPQRSMVDDQRFASRRPDVLTYQTGPLEEDVTIAGPVTAKLRVASTGTDSDFDVKLIDVYPDDYPNRGEGTAPPARSDLEAAPRTEMGGYQQLLRGEPMRAKFRNGYERPEPLVPGRAARIEFAMPDVDHTFRKGHRIMVQVQSSWFPLTDLNPQTFTDIPHAKPGDFHPATETVYHTAAEPSGVQVMVLPPS